MTGVQKNSNTELNEIMKVISDVKSQFHKDIETLKRSKAQMKIKFKDFIFQLGYLGESLAKRMNQAEVEHQNSKINY